MREADAEALAQAPGISSGDARVIRDFFRALAEDAGGDAGRAAGEEDGAE